MYALASTWHLFEQEKHMAAPGPAILVHLELAVQSTKVPREPILIPITKPAAQMYAHAFGTLWHSVKMSKILV